VAELVVPTTLDVALRLLAAPSARPIAGGVAVLLHAQLGEALATRYVAVAQLPELRGITGSERTEEPMVVIGAATTVAEIAASRLLRGAAPLLVEAAAATANPGIRTTATIGGNIIDGFGGSDLVAALLALDADAMWAVGRQQWTAPLAAGIPGAHAPSAAGPLLLAVRVATAARGWDLVRVQTRGSGDRPAITVAAARREGPDGGHALAAWATMIASQPVALVATATAFHAGVSDLRAAVDVDLADVEVTGDLRASAWYRRRVLAVAAGRALAAAAGVPAAEPRADAVRSPA
jgi:CO/xanthine dehydrogenase FAD-binding subunit